MRQARYEANTSSPYDSSSYFLIPDDCYVVWVTGCGGGGGGASGSFAQNATGGVSGCASPAFVRYPLMVRPNGILTIFVGRGCSGAGKDSTTRISNGATGIGASEQGQQYQVVTRIGGDVIGPEIWPYVPIFELGCGSTTSGPVISVKGGGSGSSSLGTFVGYIWYSSTGGAPWTFMGPIGSGENNTAMYADDSALGATAGKDVLNGWGFGLPGTYGEFVGGPASGVNSFGQVGFGAGQPVGAGNSGGASIFGKGGAGGSAESDGLGGSATGYGAGGGSSTGWVAFSGDGGDGFVLLEY